jgi:hypothetical protein
MHAPRAHADQRPFLTIVAWPEGLDRGAMANLVADATGLTLADVRMRLGQAPPMIFGQVDQPIADLAIDAVVRAGGDAFTATLDDLAAFGPTLRIKELRITGGNLDIETWQGLRATVLRENVQILVRAHLVAERKRQVPVTAPGHHVQWKASYLAFGWGGVAANAISSALQAAPTGRPIQTSDKLDIHTADGSIFQVDGDKFGYQVLGELRGHSDKANMDAMFELLAHITPNEIVDDFFALWKPPPGHERLRLPGPRPGDPAFAFYSRWVALMYRHLLDA